jgi:tetratricopeptide (TPR) repeat protein
LLESRSRALWGIGKTQEALAAQIEAAQLAPASFKINLRLARLYAALGQTEKAKEAIQTVADKHKHALLPRLYSAALLLNAHKPQEAKLVLKDYLSFLDNDYFSPPPVWPPAGEDAIHELFVRDDLEFLLSSLETSSQQKPK